MVAIRGSGGQHITTGNFYVPDAEAQVIIYHNKYTGTPPNNGGIQPRHRAFMVDGTPKITGEHPVDGQIPSSDTAAYQGNKSTTKPIPCLDENAWLDFANGLISEPANLAANYAGLPSDYKMTQDEFDNLPVDTE